MKTLQHSVKLLIALSVLSLSIPMIGQAQSSSSHRTFSVETEKPMKKALEYMDAKKYSKAEKKFKEVLKIKGLSAYETSTVEQWLGQVTYKDQDYKNSIKHFENAIAAGGLTRNDVTKSELIIAQLYVRSKQYKKALPRAESWFAVKSPKARKDYDLMNFLYSSVGQTEKQLMVLQDMTRQWPMERKLWDHQISALASTGKTFEAYQAYASLYDKGLLTSNDDLSKLVQYHEYYKRYDLAARILDAEMNKGRLERNETNQSKLGQLKRQAGATP